MAGCIKSRVHAATIQRGIRELFKVKEINRTVSVCLQPPVCTNILTEKTQVIPQRYFFSIPKIPKFPQGSNKRKEYSERRLLGYTMEQMFDIVAEVEHYNQFVPWCTKSIVTNRKQNNFSCKMEIGFPPLVERYNSLVTVQKPTYVKSECMDGKMFHHLLTIWKFSPGPSSHPNTCYLDFSVAFEFRSALHSHLSHVFFDEVVRQMVNAFLKRAKKLHGAPSIKPQKPTVLVSNA